MFAQASARVAHPSQLVAGALVSTGRAWSVSLDGDGKAHLARVGVTIGALRLYKHVRLEIGLSGATLRGDRVMLPVMWEAAGGPPIFPRMEGTLHVEPDGAKATKLTLNATYDPPLGAVGQLLDRVAMHRLAQLTITGFVERLAGVLAAELERRDKSAG